MVRRYGWIGWVLACMLAVPMMAWGQAERSQATVTVRPALVQPAQT